MVILPAGRAAASTSEVQKATLAKGVSILQMAQSALEPQSVTSKSRHASGSGLSAPLASTIAGLSSGSSSHVKMSGKGK